MTYPSEEPARRTDPVFLLTRDVSPILLSVNFNGKKRRITKWSFPHRSTIVWLLTTTVDDCVLDLSLSLSLCAFLGCQRLCVSPLFNRSLLTYAEPAEKLWWLGFAALTTLFHRESRCILIWYPLACYLAPYYASVVRHGRLTTARKQTKPEPFSTCFPLEKTFQWMIFRVQSNWKLLALQYFSVIFIDCWWLTRFCLAVLASPWELDAPSWINRNEAIWFMYWRIESANVLESASVKWIHSR